MNKTKCLVIAASLLAISGSAQAIMIDFKGLADGSLGESAWNPLMFRADGTHTTNPLEAFLEITATNGANSYAYRDSNDAGLGACGALNNVVNANQAFANSGSNLCDPSSDDNISYHSGTPERVHFVFDDDVIINSIWVNNNHDGDKSLLNDSVLTGTGGGSPTTINNGGYLQDSLISVGLNLGAGTSFDVGFDPSQSCGGSYNNCELYISKIDFTRSPIPPSAIPEPTTLALLGLGLAGMGAARRRQSK